jgi:ADP-ribosylglycohydrolase
MIGIILGDIAGSRYEFDNYKGDSNSLQLFTKDDFFTDDTILVLATMFASMRSGHNPETYSDFLIDKLHDSYQKHPNLTWGNNYARWAKNRSRQPYQSKGNGAAVRALPIAFYAKSENQLKNLSRLTCAVTHNHPLAFQYTEAIVLAAYLARTTHDKTIIKTRIEQDYFPLTMTVKGLVETYRYSELIEECVPQAITCFLEAKSMDDAFRKAIRIGGDTDTICAMVGGLCEAYYDISSEHFRLAMSYLVELTDEETLPLYAFYKPLIG